MIINIGKRKKIEQIYAHKRLITLVVMPNLRVTFFIENQFFSVPPELFWLISGGFSYILPYNTSEYHDSHFCFQVMKR